MKLRYYIVDGEGQVLKVSHSAMEGLWEGRVRADALGSPGKSELRLISVLCDDRLQPRTIYLLRVPLVDGLCTSESQLTLQIFTMRDCVTSKEVVQHHGSGWPRDLRRQLAVVLDVPVAHLDGPIQIGGPLFLAAAMGVSPQEAAQFLR
jgi:hypothetical protein